MLYLASSWRNRLYPAVLAALQAARVDVYDFREQGAAFDWRDVDAEWRNDAGTRIEYPPQQMVRMLYHSEAERGWRRDFAALDAAAAGLLVAPCGRSAHLELGYLAGKGRPTGILVHEPHEPELMYRLADTLLTSIPEAVAWAHAAAASRPPPLLACEHEYVARISSSGVLHEWRCRLCGASWEAAAVEVDS